MGNRKSAVPASIPPVIGPKSLGPVWTPIGSGGFGEVYKTRNLKCGRDVAIKLLCGDDGTFTDADLVCEAELMRSRENQYVMKVESFFKGCQPGSPMLKIGIVTLLMENGSLASLQEKLNRLPPWPLVFRMARQVAMGMNYLHGLTPALIHKDLKPENILLDTGLNVKITEFGLARFDNVKTERKLKGACTPFYAPPEVFQGLPGGATTAYDVYSYGILLWRILNTGQNIFPFKCYVDEERPPLEYINGLQADGLEELVKLMKWCWSQKKEDRPSFKECIAATEPLYQMHTRGIPQAVCQVQMELHCPDPPPVLEGSRNRPDPPPVPEGSTKREDFLKHAFSLSMDPSSVNNELSLSEDNRKVTYSEQDQRHPDHPDRFTHYTQVLSSNSLPKCCYFEVKWCERYIATAVSYGDISRNERQTSGFGRNDKSWMLWRATNRYRLRHNGITTEVFETEESSRVSGDDDDGGVVGVYVGHAEGTVSFYSVSNNRMTLLHTVQTDATQPLYAGICIPDSGTAEVCEIW